MLLIIIHLLNGTSLLETSIIARMAKLGEMSEVAFMNRLAGCTEWFKEICGALLRKGEENYRQPDWLADRTVAAVDASDVVEKGSTRRTYRLHYALDIFNMASFQCKITEQAIGETLVNFTCAPGMAEQSLELYRLRWQVELYFKRLKSILDFGELPKKKSEHSLAWLNGKLMVALLIESVIAKSFSPLEKQGYFDFEEYLA
jgi:hypothetical protein